MPSLETPRGVLTFKILHHSRGGCATFSVQESFWFAQPSRQGWLGLLLVFMVDRSLFGARFLAEACFLVVFGEEPACHHCYDEQEGNLRMLKQVSRYGYQYVHGLNSFPP